jgi:hypothetical protein
MNPALTRVGFHRLVNMKRILAKFFWRIILPFILALLIAAVAVMEASGRVRGGFSGGGGGGSLFHGVGFLYITAALFCEMVGLAFWRTLRWGKEAEEFE